MSFEMDTQTEFFVILKAKIKRLDAGMRIPACAAITLCRKNAPSFDVITCAYFHPVIGRNDSPNFRFVEGALKADKFWRARLSEGLM